MSRVLAAAVLLGVLGAAAFLYASAPAPSPTFDDTPERRWQQVDAASRAAIPGAVELVAAFPAKLHGDERRVGTLVTQVGVLRTRFDWSNIPMDDARGGPVELLLAQAHLHEESLARAGFAPMAATGHTTGWEGRIPVERSLGGEMGDLPGTYDEPGPLGTRRRPHVEVIVHERSDSGGGHGPYRIDLNQPRIVHRRIYMVPGTSAVLFVTLDYDQAKQAVEVELSYADRTLLGQEYPKGGHIVGRTPDSYSVQETIVPARR